MQITDKIRCVVCDDHEALRLGVVRALDAVDDLEVVGQADNGLSAIQMIDKRRPHVAVVDLQMPDVDGLAVATAVAEADSSTAVLVYTASLDAAGVQSALAAGAAGYVLKTGPVQELARAIRLVARGGRYVDPTLLAAMFDAQTDPNGSLLTERESEVLQLLADGLTTRAAAERLFLAPTTVRSYIENAMQKLGTNSRTGAVASALRDGLIN